MAGKDAISVLESDHERVKKLLTQLGETTERGVKIRQDLLSKVEKEIQIHTQIEEEIFYPAFHEAAERKNDEALYYEALEEHRLVDIELPELASTDVATPQFTARAKVVKDLVEHHVQEEENQLFPRVRKLFSKDELMMLGERLQARRQELQA